MARQPKHESRRHRNRPPAAFLKFTRPLTQRVSSSRKARLVRQVASTIILLHNSSAARVADYLQKNFREYDGKEHWISKRSVKEVIMELNDNSVVKLLSSAERKNFLNQLPLDQPIDLEDWVKKCKPLTAHDVENMLARARCKSIPEEVVVSAAQLDEAFSEILQSKGLQD